MAWYPSVTGCWTRTTDPAAPGPQEPVSETKKPLPTAGAFFCGRLMATQAADRRSQIWRARQECGPRPWGPSLRVRCGTVAWRLPRWIAPGDPLFGPSVGLTLRFAPGSVLSHSAINCSRQFIQTCFFDGRRFDSRHPETKKPPASCGGFVLRLARPAGVWAPSLGPIPALPLRDRA